jgi:hypothetical protein
MLLRGIKVSDLLFTGFTNFQQVTCYLNVLLQLFCQTDFLSEVWMDASPQIGEIQKCLADILSLHGAGAYECIAPVEALHMVLSKFAPHGIMADIKNDALELLFLIRQALEVPDIPEHMHCVFYRLYAGDRQGILD